MRQNANAADSIIFSQIQNPADLKIIYVGFKIEFPFVLTWCLAYTD